MSDHRGRRVSDVRVFVAVEQLRGHHGTHRGFARIFTLGDCAHHDVTIGDHAHDPAVLLDRQDSDVFREHQRCGILQGAFYRNDSHVSRHDVANLHEVLREMLGLAKPCARIEPRCPVTWQALVRISRAAE
jgi:hypothetical protein